MFNHQINSINQYETKQKDHALAHHTDNVIIICRDNESLYARHTVIIHHEAPRAIVFRHRKQMMSNALVRNALPAGL